MEIVISPQLKVKITRRERLKSGLYLRLKKRKTFFEKNLKFLIFFFRKMSHSAEKCERGTLWDVLTYIQLRKIKKLEWGTLLRH